MARTRRGRQEGSVYQRSDGVWTGSVSFGYDDAGRRKRRTVYGESKKAVLDKLDKLKRDFTQGVLVSPGRLTLGDFLDRWLATDVKPNRAPGTHKQYSDTVRLHVKPQLGGVQVAQLTPAAIAAAYAALERNKVPARARQLVHSVLHRALRRATDWKLIAWNPCTSVERPRGKRAEIEAVSSHQVRALVAVATGQPLEALFVTAATTGLRQGELFALRWRDVDLTAKSLRVVHSLEELSGKLRLKEPKSANGRRTVELSAVTVAALAAHHVKMKDKGFVRPDDPVFCDSHGGWLRKSNFTRNVFDPIRKKAGVPAMRFHHLRHFHASFLTERGTSAKVLQERLGHADVATTMRFYVHARQEAHREAADAIDAAFVDPPKTGKKTRAKKPR